MIESRPRLYRAAVPASRENGGAVKRERTGSRVPYHLFVIVFAVLSLMSARAWACPQASGDDAASPKG